MERTFLLKGLDCPHCSAKIEAETGKITGVENAAVNLIKQTLTFTLSEAFEGSIYEEIEKIVHKHEPNVEVIDKSEKKAARKSVLLKGLNCPHCSAEIEEETRKIAGVENAEINLIKQTLSFTLGEAFEGNIYEEIEKIVHKHEPNVEVVFEESRNKKANIKEDKEDNSNKIRCAKLIIGAVVYAVGISLDLIFKAPLPLSLGTLIVSYVILGADVLLKAFKNILKGRVFDENFLMTVSTIGAFIIGEYPEAAAVMLFYQVGELFQDMAVRRSRKSIADLMNIRPDFANVKRGEEFTRVSPEEILEGETILVKPGEKIPLDGIVTSGASALDTKALTGESLPKDVKEGDAVLSGCINERGALTIRVSKTAENSTAAKIIDLVENAASRKAPAENFITSFSEYYTPVVVISAVLLAIVAPLFFNGDWSDWIHRGFVFLVISCPCALVISIPLTFFGGLGAASKKGILVKGGNYLEAVNKIDTIVFDKTGTLTKGVFKVIDVIAENGYTEEDVLAAAAKAECMSNHPIARSIVNAYKGSIDKNSIKEYTEISGRGVSVLADGLNILAGSGKLMADNNIEFKECEKIGTKIYTALNNKYIGCIVIADEIKEDSKRAIEGLKKSGINKIIMLTGDNEQIGKDVSEKLGIDEYYAQLLPDQKVERLEEIFKRQRNGGKTAFVGDGINDAPVLARADIGIAMGGLGSDAAVEAADIVLMTDEPSKLIEALDTAKATKHIVMQNIVFALGVKAVFLVLGAFGIAGMWEAVFGDVGVMIIAVLNAMRILRK